MAEGIVKASDVTESDIYGLATASLEKYIAAVDKSNKDLTTQAELLERITKSANTQSKKGIDELTTANRELTKVVSQANVNDQERMKIVQQETKLRAKLDQTLKGERDELVKLQEQNRRATKEARDNAKAILDQGDAYETLKRDTNAAQLEAKKMAAQFGINSRQAVEARKKFELLDDELREINTSTRDGRRDVGRYGEAIRDVRDTTLKWTAAITGAAASLVGLFNAASSQDKLNKRLKASFDLTGESLDNVSKKVEFLSKAYDVEINEVIETATALTNEFGIESEKSFTLIEQGFAKGANVRGEFLEQLKEYSTQFVNVGLSADEAIAIITQQENRGVFSDKGIDAIKEAGIRLTEMPKATLEALAAIGISGEEIQQQITSGQKTVFEATQEISNEIAKLPPNAQEVGTVLADVFGGAGEDAKGFVLSLGEVSTELGDLEDTTTDFEKAQQELIKRFVDIKQEVGNALVPVFSFLARNLMTIITVVGKMGAAFLTFKTIMFGLKMKDRISEWISFRKAVKNGSDEMGNASKSAKGFGRNLKAIGFTVAIGLAYELAQAFYDVASGARQARYDAEQLEKQMGRVNRRVDADIEKRQKELSQKLDLVKTDKERLKLQEDFNRTNREKASALEKELELEKKRLVIFKAGKDALDNTIDGNILLTKTLFESTDQMLDQVGTFEDMDDKYAKQLAKVKALEAGIKKYNITIADTSHELKVMTKDTQENTDAKEKNAEATEQQVKAYKDLSDQIDSILNAGQSLTEIEDEEIAAENEKIRKNLTQRLTEINEFERSRKLTTEQAAEQRVIAELEAALERKGILEIYGRDTIDIENEISARRLELVNRGSKQVLESEKDTNDEILKARQELFNTIEELGEQEIDRFIENSKRKQSAIDDEISALQKLDDQIRNSADSQNAIASQSLAAIEEQTNQKIKEKQDEANKEAALEELKAAWNALNSFLDQGDNFTSATAKALTGVGTFKKLTSALSSIPFFAKGTKNAPEGLAITDEQGAEIHLDKHGNIKDMGSNDGARLKYLEQGDQILTASESKAKQTELLNRQLSGAAMMANIQMNSKKGEDDSLLLEMRMLREDIKNDTKYSWHPIFRNGMLAGVREQQRTGNKIENYRTLTRS